GRVADDGAVQLGEAGPVDCRRGLALVLVAAHQRDRVAAARVGEGNARVAGNANRRRDPRHDLEWHALLVEKEGLLAAAIEHEWIAPLEARDRSAFAGLLDEEVTDSFLCRRVGRGRAD